MKRLKMSAFPFVQLVNFVVVFFTISTILVANGTEAKYSLYKSTDGGSWWSLAGEGLPSDVRINALTVLGDVAVAGTDRGIFTSRDAGAQWQATMHGVGTGARVLCLAIHGKRILAGTLEHGVIFSDDEGMNWNTMNVGLSNLYVRSLLSVGTKLYAGTDSKGTFVFDDAGASWTNQRGGLPDSAQVFDMVSLDGTIFAGLYSHGLYRWNPERATWAKSGEVFPLQLAAAGKTLVVGHNPGGVFISDDRGETWLDGNAGLPTNAPTWTLAADDNQVFIGTSGKVKLAGDDIGLFVSRNRGRTWTRSDAGLPRSSAAICFAVTKQFILTGISTGKQRGH